jgi:glycosyltransferase involved in cell wall biosynthesis
MSVVPTPAPAVGVVVSVVMPTFNRASLLRETAHLVLSQTFTALELIIVDDCSSDETAQVGSALEQADARVTYVRLPTNQGIAVALNEGFRRATGNYIQICHDHDIYLPTLTEKMAELLDRHSSVAFVHPGRQGCDHLGQPLKHAYFVCGYPEVSDGLAWRKRMLRSLASPVTALCMVRRSALDQVGPLDPSFGACCDVDLWMRLCAVGDVGYVNELLLLVRGREPGHPYGGVNWTLTDQVVRIHQRHMAVAYPGPLHAVRRFWRRLEIDFSLSFDYLNSARHRRWAEVSTGRRYLRRHGFLVSKVISAIL